MILLHDKCSHQEKNQITHKHSQNFFKHFNFFPFIFTQFTDFASLKVQMQIAFAKSFNVLNKAA